MWFTIAFFTYPIALFLVYKAFKDFEKNGLRNLVIAITIFILPISLLLFERNNLLEIEQDLIGTYISEKDTLTLNKSEFFLKSNFNVTNGSWELIANDNLQVRLTEQNKETKELKITYESGQTKLTIENTTYEKLTK